MVWFFILSVAIVIAIAFGIMRIKEVESKHTNVIVMLFIAAIITIILNAVTVLPVSKTAYVLLHGLYLAATDWLVLVLVLFTWKFTDTSEKGRKVLKTYITLSAVDTVLLVANVFENFMFTAEKITAGGHRIYAARMIFPAYIIHFVVAYSMVLAVIIVFLHKIVVSPDVFRGKYWALFWSLLSIVAANVGYRFLDVNVDFSPIFYAVLIAMICYFTLFYAARSIVAKMLAYSIQDMDTCFICFDNLGRCIYANSKAEELFRIGDDVSQFERNLKKWANGRPFQDILEMEWQDSQLINGEMRHYNVSYKPLLDIRRNFIGGYFAAVDVTEERKEAERQRYRAIHDPLTDIYNREGFFEKVSELLVNNSNQSYTMVCTDIKEFKLVNELFGEKHGDYILKEVAKLIKNNASEGTLYCRLGTDRFAIFMETDKFIEENYYGYVNTLAELANNSVFRMHIHVGVYKDVNRVFSAAAMCDRAQLAIQKIKDDYNRVVAYYDESLAEDIKNDNRLLGEFDNALEGGQFEMFLQPQVSRDNEIVGAEALVRWRHPEDGMIAPGRFIPLFERVSYIHKLDMYIWEQACRKLAEWKKQGNYDMYISVNISPKDFYLIDIFETVTGLVEKYKINPRVLKLEITETALMADIKQQVDLIERLRAYGFIVEIDDFGSGFSSLNTLKDIKVDVLKLDMGFLAKTRYQERGNSVISFVIALSKELGLSVVSEGVETNEQVEFLSDTGCEVFQGYFFAKPMPVAEFEQKYFYK